MKKRFLSMLLVLSLVVLNVACTVEETEDGTLVSNNDDDRSDEDDESSDDHDDYEEYVYELIEVLEDGDVDHLSLCIEGYGLLEIEDYTDLQDVMDYSDFIEDDDDEDVVVFSIDMDECRGYEPLTIDGEELDEEFEIVAELDDEGNLEYEEFLLAIAEALEEHVEEDCEDDDSD